jgi:hypothetical protein
LEDASSMIGRCFWQAFGSLPAGVTNSFLSEKSQLLNYFCNFAAGK